MLISVLEKLKTYARQINPDLAFIELSARTGEGMDGGLDGWRG